MRPVHLNLDEETITTFKLQADRAGMKLSPWLRSFARILRMEITMKTPMEEIFQRFHEYVEEEKRQQMEAFTDENVATKS